MGILNIGTQALQANLVALQTTGNNISNVNTPGYSRQKAVLTNIPGQYTGLGYIGKGVMVQTVVRSYDDFLIRQSALASSVQAGDQVRNDKLAQLQSIFSGGTEGLGASINQLLNSFSDVASAPTDLTARTVALTRVDETASQMRAASQRMDDLIGGVSQEVSQKVDAINSLANSIAKINEEIARTKGAGQPPNDLLDQRDQMVRDLNRYIQTSTVPADDGTLGVFIGGSQPLVLGTDVSPLQIVRDDFGDLQKNKLAINHSGTRLVLDENTLGGGEVAGLLKFQNSDLTEGRNLLGRLTLAVTTAINAQHKLGLDLDGNPGGNLFTPITLGTQNVLTPVAPATPNAGNASLTLGISDSSKFVASDYEVTYTGATSGTIKRLSDGTVTNFTSSPVVVDGISIQQTGTASAGDRFLIKPYSTSANNIARAFSTPRALAVASPVAGLMGAKNTGSLQLASLVARSNPPLPAPGTPVTLTFTGPGSYTRSDELPPNTTTYTYVPGQAIEGSVPATTPLSNWSLVLQGTPKAGDTFTVRNNPYTANDAGNAKAMMNLRDQVMFDGASLSDGYAGLISQIGIRTQSASYAAQVSTQIATSLEKDRTGVSGVNLDEEAAKLLQYQQAYQASAKMIQIAQNIFDSLLVGLGR